MFFLFLSWNWNSCCKSARFLLEILVFVEMRHSCRFALSKIIQYRYCIMILVNFFHKSIRIIDCLIFALHCNASCLYELKSNAHSILTLRKSSRGLIAKICPKCIAHCTKNEKQTCFTVTHSKLVKNVDVCFAKCWIYVIFVTNNENTIFPFSLS